MHLPLPAGAQHAALAAGLSTIVAAAALPAAAQAGTAELRDGKLLYTARNAEVNNVVVRSGANGTLIIADTAARVAGPGCLLNGSGELECDATGVSSIELSLADREDTIRYKAPQPGIVNAGIGRDTFFGGLRQAPLGPVVYHGGDGLNDALRYAEADRGVVVSLGSGSSDGRPGDLENAGGDIEVLEGSPFGDTLTGTDDGLGEVFLGAGGVDTIDGRGGPDRFDEGSGANGGDVIDGGPGRDLIDYSRRASRVRVQLDGTANDGAESVSSSEGDNVKPTVEDVITGRGDDVLLGSPHANDLRSGAGFDQVHGSQRSTELEGDTIDPGAGPDRVQGTAFADVFFTRDGENDDISCLGGVDFATTDVLDVDGRLNGTAPGTDAVNACEAVDAPVGVLRVRPRTLRAGDDARARVTLSWRHPRHWRNLSAIQLRLTQGGLVVGAITIRPGNRRIADDGAIRLAHGDTRLSTHGRTVTARLALRLDRRLAGATLRAEIEATDKRGRRQVERAPAA
jgi:hypothetical protein